LHSTAGTHAVVIPMRVGKMTFCGVQETWRRLGFVFTTAEDLTAFGILHTDLIHMDNTVQMHKTVAPARIWKTVIFK
jgi:hypothetical protein